MASDLTTPAIAAAHSTPAAEIIEMLDSSALYGLSKSVADSRLHNYGPNALTPIQKYSAWRTFIGQLKDPQMLLLFGAAALSFSVWLLQRSRGVPVESLFIAGVGLINASLGFAQEHRAHQAMEALRRMTPVLATVLREGDICEILAEKIVPGDILVLRDGCIVPADARVLQSSSLNVVEAPLTGESGSVIKSTAAVPVDFPVADRSSILFSGTAVLSGSGTAVVVATGDSTELGKISKLVQSTDGIATPLQKQIASVSKALAVAVVALAVTFSVLFLLSSHLRTVSDITGVVLFSVSLAVAASPEALATIVTLTLALAGHRLARQGAIVRKMAAIETLGASSVILCDKTGTVTLNKLTVQDLLPARAILANATASDIEQVGLLEASLVASVDAEGSLVAGRDSVDRAIWAYAQEHKSAIVTSLREFRAARILPFTSDRKSMSVLAIRGSAGQYKQFFTKGAPEVILDGCNQINHSNRAITATERQYIKEFAARLASNGLKVLAVASRNSVIADLSSIDQTELQKDLTFLGLLTLADPVREGVEQTIRETAASGIRTILITGDHPRAAAAIAKTIGIPDAERVLTGPQIDVLADPALFRQLTSCNVLARVTPSHKLRVARVLQAEGEVVAMTGDGVNDAPALKQADVGIALGSGTDLAKQSADVILTDDGIATIFRGIDEGRLVFGNVRRAAIYLFASNLSEILALCLLTVLSLLRASSGALYLPLRTEQILWINLVTDTAPALALSFGRAEKASIENGSALRSGRLLDAQGIIQILLYSFVITGATLMARFISPGGSREYDQTVTVTTLVQSQAFFALTLMSRRESLLQSYRKHLHLFVAVAIVFILQALVPRISIGKTVTGMIPLDLQSWSICLALSLSPILLHEYQQFYRRHLRRRARHPAASGSRSLREAR